ncbi:recombinase RecT [Burkholderia cenocepacia]|uniref:recombinase RecT n=1 Tax=Burkholderia cenocepacia TaxID=95486 RepID=UPI00222F14B7|nr:recombinase RecT [Burkholderia cenocepacia]MCW3678790.1 recombinase RecT [Burkholderia cenocepacia]
MSTATLKQVATGKKDNPVASFSSFLDKFKPQMALALPKHLTVDRMARLAVTAFSSTPKLQECEPKTIVASIMTAATLGLEIGVDGQGFLVPYGRTCQFVPGWKGLVDLVSRSGRATVWTGAVFEGDEFDYALGDSPFIRHRPGEENDPDKITHVYAVGRVNGSEYPVIEVWTIRKVWKHRDKYNKVGAKHYSFRDPEMYARKVPLLQVLKYMPKSIELQNAMAIANAADNGHHAVIDGNFVTVTDPDTGATVDPSTGELTDQRQQQADMAPSSYDDLLSQIRNAKDEEVLALVLDSARDLPQAEYVKLEQAYQDRREVLMGA